MPGSKYVDFLFPHKPVSLDVVSHFAVEASVGNLDWNKFKIIYPEKFTICYDHNPIWYPLFKWYLIQYF